MQEITSPIYKAASLQPSKLGLFAIQKFVNSAKIREFGQNLAAEFNQILTQNFGFDQIREPNLD